MTSHIAHTTLSLLQAHAFVIQLSINGMSSVGYFGDGDLPMLDNLHIQQFLTDGWNGITQRMLNVWGTCL